jgi:hypothetical protein
MREQMRHQEDSKTTLQMLGMHKSRSFASSATCTWHPNSYLRAALRALCGAPGGSFLPFFWFLDNNKAMQAPRSSGYGFEQCDLQFQRL